ncbi:MAG: PASTA domain-containing protein, partial [Clostridia bacterium]|nr:PASTA domain-containing protein [Clostridia bacterium]
YSYAAAKKMLEDSGLYVSTSGTVPNKNHVVRGQSVAPLAQVEYGSTIIIELSDKTQNAAT